MNFLDDAVLHTLCRRCNGAVRHLVGEVLVFFDHSVPAKRFEELARSAGYTVARCGTQAHVSGWAEIR